MKKEKAYTEMITFVRTNVGFKERIKQVATRAAETDFQTKAISVSLCRHHVGRNMG
jgi:hypothetical protein